MLAVGLGVRSVEEEVVLKLVLIIEIRNSLMFFVIAQPPGRQASGGWRRRHAHRQRELLDSPGLSGTEARTAGGRNPPWQG